jgi:hypothetical protein
MSSSLNKTEWGFALLAALSGSILVFGITSTYGPGVSSDSVFYLASADHFAAGEGFFDMSGEPLIDFPPAYSFLLGTLRWAFGMPSLNAGRLLNFLAYALTVLCAAVLFKRCFPQRPLWFYLGTLATLLSLSLYTMASNIGSDLFFVLSILCFYLLSQDFLARKRLLTLTWLALLAAFVGLLRWVGLSMTVALVILVWIAYRSNRRKALIYSLAFGALGSLPVMIWSLLRNYLVHATLGRAGYWDSATISVPGNLSYFYSKMSQWFVPVQVTNRIPLFVFLLAALAVLLVINKKANWLFWVRRFALPTILPILVFSLVYLISVSVTGITVDHSDYYDDRYPAPLYFSILIAFFITLDELVLVHIHSHKRVADLITIVLFAAWAFYPLTLIYKFTLRSLENGVVAYNLYNTKAFHDAGLVKYLQSFPFEENAVLYSNITEAVYLFTGRPVRLSPQDPKNYYADPDTLQEYYQQWPPESKAYLIWFETIDKRNYYNPRSLRIISSMKKLYEDPDGLMLVAAPKQP